MKILEDKIPGLEALLVDVNAFQDELDICRTSLLPYAEAKRQQLFNGSLPVYLATTRDVLRAVRINNVMNDYPMFSSFVANGTRDDSGYKRIYNGVFKLGSLKQGLVDRNYMVKTDSDRNELRDLANQVLADFTVFIISQARLNEVSVGVYLSVSKLCDRLGVTPEVYYGKQLTILESTGKSVYGYEEISPYYSDLLEIDPVFVSECEEAGFPLDEEMCQCLLSGKLDVTELRGQLLEFMKSSDIQDVGEAGDVTTFNLIHKMNLG